MVVTWSESAAKHSVPRDEALYAMSHAHAIYPEFQAPRGGFRNSVGYQEGEQP